MNILSSCIEIGKNTPLVKRRKSQTKVHPRSWVTKSVTQSAEQLNTCLNCRTRNGRPKYYVPVFTRKSTRKAQAVRSPMRMGSSRGSRPSTLNIGTQLSPRADAPLTSRLSYKPCCKQWQSSQYSNKRPGYGRRSSRMLIGVHPCSVAAASIPLSYEQALER